MNKRHVENTNLKLHYDQYWQGLHVQTHRGPLVDNYLHRIHETMMYSLIEHPRTCIIQFCLAMPAHLGLYESNVISRFIDSLNAQLRADEARKQREGSRVHGARLRFVWVREKDTSINWHYHVAIFLNHDAYFTLGKLRSHNPDAWQDVPQDPMCRMQSNMAGRIQEAWCRALRIQRHEGAGLVHFSGNNTLSVNVNSAEYHYEFSDAFYRLSYLAKADTKHYGGNRNFGCSVR